MANTKDYVSVGKPKIGGAIWRAPAASVTAETMPDDATSTLDAAFICMGYLSTDGLKNNNSKESTEIKAWGGDTVAIPTTGHTDTFEGTFIESLNTEVLKAAHGAANVSGDLANGISISANASDESEYVYVADMLLHGNVKKRVVIPCGRISAVGEITYKDDEVVGYPLTITGLPDSSENTHYEYIQQVSCT